MLTSGQESSPLTEIDGGNGIRMVTFTVNGEYIIGCGHYGLGVWRVEGEKQTATMAARVVHSLAVVRRITVGTLAALGYATVWA